MLSQRQERRQEKDKGETNGFRLKAGMTAIPALQGFFNSPFKRE